MASLTHGGGPPARESDHGGRLRDSSPTIARSMAIVCRNVLRERSSLLTLGPFELVRTLGRGGHGVVYEAFDPLRREPLALKLLYGRGPSYLYRLKREFRSLAELRHPSLVALHELSVGPHEPYFTMDLIAGCDLLTHIERLARGGDALAGTRDALTQLCEGVQFLHRAGKLHRDLKPSNVLVTEAGRVVLLDFGLVDDAGAGVTEPAGTPAYMAPEQARGAACPSSDWYSFGRVLQQALDVLRGSGEGVAALEQLAVRLVDPDPSRRASFEEIIACVALRPAVAVPPAALPAPEHGPSRFVAREAELQQLNDALERSRSGPVCVLVRGESGIGKSALLREFARTSGASAGVVLHGRCYEREVLPYKALDSAIDELSRVLIGLPAEHRVRSSGGDHAALLAVFPVLGRVAWLNASGQPPNEEHPVELRARGFAALRTLLAQLSTERSLVLCIDDLQWADADSGRLLGALLCEEDSPRLLMVATDRADRGAANPAIEELQRVAELSPQPLHIEELAIGPLDATASVALAREPIEQRLRELSRSSRLVLELVAAAARPLSSRAIAAAANRTECHAQVKELRARGLVRAVLRGADEWLELEHDRIGEAVLATVASGARRALHAQLVLALEAEPGAVREALIDQYLGAGMEPEAARCARSAAAVALDALAFTRAARLYEQALALGDWDAEDRIALLADHGFALEHAGRGLDAAAVYERAAALCADPQCAAQLERRAAEQLMRNGREVAGELVLARGYRRLGLGWPANPLGLVLSIARLALPARLRRMFSRASVASEALLRVRAEFLGRVGSSIELYDLLRALHNALLCFDQGEQLADPAWHARTRGARGMLRAYSLWPGGAARGTQELVQAAAVAQELGDVAASADLLAQLAFVHYFGGRPREAFEAADRSAAFRRMLPESPMFDSILAVSTLGAALFDLGRLREARRRWNALNYAARLQGDLATTLWVHAHPLQLAVLFATEERARCQAIVDRLSRLRSEQPHHRMIAWSHAVVSIEHALYWGASGDAVQVAERDHRVLFGLHNAPFEAKARLLRARACIRAATGQAPARRRAAWLRRAARDAAVLRRQRGAQNQGIALLLSAGVALQRGRHTLAIEHLDAAVVAFEQSEAKLLAASARYCRAALVAGPAAEASRASALDVFHGEGVVDPGRYIAWMVCGFGAAIGDGR